MSEDQKAGHEANETNMETPPSGRGGPRTAQGKNRAKYNATGHGIFAKIVLRSFGESEEDFKKLLEALRMAIKPADSLQDIQVEQLAFEYLRMTRVYKADAEVASYAFDKLKKQLTREEEDNDNIIYLGRYGKCVVLKDIDPELVLKYGNTVSKQIHRILGELGRLPTEKH